jgi:hypothetical protein
MTQGGGVFIQKDGKNVLYGDELLRARFSPGRP